VHWRAVHDKANAVSARDANGGAALCTSAWNHKLFNNGDPFDSDASDGAECPLSSIVGEVDVDVPLLDEPLEGKVVLGMPKSVDPTSGEMFRLFLMVEDEERGLIAKIFESSTADPNAKPLPGMLASVKDLPLCKSGQAAASACSAGSKIGSVDGTALAFASTNPILDSTGQLPLLASLSVQRTTPLTDASSPFGSFAVRPLSHCSPSWREN
jgi:hypothetical protein